MIRSVDDMLFVGSVALVIALELGQKVALLMGACWLLDLGIDALVARWRAL